MPGARVHLLVVGMLLTAAPLPVSAQDNLDKGKSPAELFKTNCAECHKAPRGLGASMRGWSLSGFLAQHYTSSKAAADALASYVAGANQQGREETPRRRTRAAAPDKNKKN